MAFIPHPDYQAPSWLPGGHLQTLYPALFARNEPLTFTWERIPTPDGDFIDIAWHHHPHPQALYILFHGLEGNSESHYALSLMQAVHASGASGAVVHFRGCSGKANIKARAYHSGDSEEVNWILSWFAHQAASLPRFAIGVSLGGNVLLKWLGEAKNHACTFIQKAIAVSAPMALETAARTIDTGLNRYLYARHFLATLKPKAIQKITAHQLLISPKAILNATTLATYDDLFTAPVHGFRNATDYWRQSASLPLLPYITLPTLIINARNDPFMPAASLPTQNQVSPFITLYYPEEGGHAGFICGPFPGKLDWLSQCIINFCNTKT
ncbi:MAG: hydrolase [Pseudomonadota bacterium]|nr:hydrolase [Pseudomonadota bacterium]